MTSKGKPAIKKSEHNSSKKAKAKAVRLMRGSVAKAAIKKDSEEK